MCHGERTLDFDSGPSANPSRPACQRNIGICPCGKETFYQFGDELRKHRVEVAHRTQAIRLNCQHNVNLNSTR
jgi:hypothetical protein